MIINQTQLQAVAKAMAVKDVRYYLNGVFVEHNGIETRLTATDGHRMHSIRMRDESAELVQPVSFIMPAAMVKTLCSAKFARWQKKEFELNFTAGDAPGKGNITAKLPDGTVAIASEIDDHFPDYRRIIPAKVSGEHATFEAQYLLDAQEAVKLLDNNTKWAATFPRFNGEGPAVLEHIVRDGGGNMFIAVIMPTHVKISTSQPSAYWKQELAAPAASVAATAR